MKPDDIELVSLQGLPPFGAPAASTVQSRLSYTAELVLEDFYERQRARHGRDRERLLRSRAATSTSKPQQNCFSAKWNRQALYLDDSSRGRALVTSRRHLARHPEWWDPGSRLSPAQLREIVGAQHYFDVDFEDLLMPEGQRRSEDTYSSAGSSASADVCDQFLLDAPRSTFVVEGETFDLATEAQANADNPEVAQDGKARLQRAFVDRLVAAVQRCLATHGGGGSGSSSALAPPLLLKAITTAMSQSGMASLERATAQPQVVASGGNQVLKYELRCLSAGDSFMVQRDVGKENSNGALKEPLFAAAAAGGTGLPRVWELQLLVRKHDFHQCMVFASSPDDEAIEDPLPLTCGPGSVVEKACTLHIWMAAERAHVDMVELKKEVNIFGEDGQPIDLPQPPDALVEQRQQAPPRSAITRLLLTCARFVGGSCWAFATCLWHLTREVSVRAQRRMRRCCPRNAR